MEIQEDENPHKRNETKRNQDGKEKKVKIILVKNVWQYEENITEKNDKGKKENMSDSRHKGDCIIKMNLTNESKLKSRILNNMKIASFLHSKNLQVECMKITGFNKTEVKFRNRIEANRCIDLVTKQDKKIIEARIPSRVTRRKGVIMNWDQELELKILAETLVNEKKDIIQIKKMKRRYYDADKKEVMTKFTDNLIVTFDGNNLPNEIKIYNRLVNLRVRPFIEAVKQCFNCFKFGHIKSVCRAKKMHKLQQGIPRTMRRNNDMQQLRGQPQTHEQKMQRIYTQYKN